VMIRLLLEGKAGTNVSFSLVPPPQDRTGQDHVDPYRVAGPAAWGNPV